MSVKISAFGNNKIEFNIENSIFNMNYIMQKNNGIKVYDKDGKLIKKDYEDRDKYFSYYEYM